MNIVIVDDSYEDRKLLGDFVSEYSKINSIFTKVRFFENGEEFLEKANLDQIDALFLDIYMGELNGIDVAEIVRKKGYDIPIVFITTSKDYAVKSYEVRTFDYLLKPVSYENLARTINFLQKQCEKNSKFIVVKEAREPRRVILDKINYIDYHNHYVQIHTDSEIIKTYLKFEEFESDMITYDNFLTCYRCVMVNMKRIKKIEKGFFQMKNGEFVPINRTRAKEIKAAYFDYVFGEMGDMYE